MKTLLKLILFLIMFLVVVLLALPLIIDPNDFKGQITQRVEEHTGRALTIGGDIKLSVFPWLGAELAQVSLGNEPGFGDKPFAEVEKAAVRVKLIPLLEKKVEVDTVVLHGVRAHLIKAKDGRTNWESLVGGGNDKKDGKKGGPGIEALLIGGVDVGNAQILWDDRMAGQAVHLKDFNLSTGKLVLGEAFDIAADGDVRMLPKGPAFTMGMKGKVAFEPDGSKVSIVPLELSLAEEKGGQSLKIEGVFDADLAKGNISLQKLEATSGDLKLAGSLQVTNFKKSPALKGSLAVSPFSPKKLMKDFGIAPPKTSDPAVLQNSSLSFSLSGSPQRVDISKLKLRLDDTQLAGSAKLVMAARPTVNFELNGDQLNLDRYMSPPVKRQGPVKGADVPLPIKALFAADLNGRLSLNKLIVNKMVAESVVLKVDQFNNRLQIDQSVGSFYKGNFRGTAVLNASKGTPILNYSASMNGLQVGPLLKDMTGQDRLSGTGQVRMEMKSSGKTVLSMRRALRGDVTVNFRNGAIKGFNLAQIIRDGKSKIKSLRGESSGSQSSSDASQQTDFSELSAKAKVKGAVINNTTLAMKSPYLRVNGGGTLNTDKQWLDYRLRTVVVNSAVGQGGKDFSELENIPLPMKYRGPVSEVGNWRKWKIDFEDVLKAKLEKKLKEEEKKAKEKLKREVLKKLGVNQPESSGGATQEKPKSDEERALEMLKKLF